MNSQNISKTENKNSALAIVCPQVGAVSETFIRMHIEHLLPSKTVILTGKVVDESWFQGPIKIIPIELGAYSFDNEIEKEVIKYFEENSVTHILCEFGCIGGAVVELNNRVMKLPIYVHFHGQDASEFIQRPEIAAYYKWMGNIVNGVVAVSKPMKERLVKVGIPEEKIKIIHYGVDYNNECKVTPEKNPCRFVSVSRLVGKKGIPYVLQAYEKTQKEVPDVTLDIIGEGPLRSEIEKFISEHKLGESVKLHGEQSHEYVLNMMDRSSVFVQHSLVDPETGNREGLPLSILEASAHGLPVISTFHEGIPEAIEHEHSGFLVEEKDWESMANFMIKLAKDGSLRIQMGIAGREKISNEDFTVDVMLAHLRSFIGLEKEYNYPLQGKINVNTPTLRRVLFVNHSVYPYEVSGTPITTLNHAMGIKNKGIEVAVLFPSNDILNSFSKEVNENYTLYKVPRLDKYETFMGDMAQFHFKKYINTIEKIIQDFKPDLVHINDYVFMPDDVVSAFSKSGAYVVRNVCNLEEICFLDFPVYLEGGDGVLCSGPDSPDKCAECYLVNILKKDRDTIDPNKIEKFSQKIKKRFDSIKSLYKEHVDGVIFTEKTFENYFNRFIHTSHLSTKINPRGFQFSQARKISSPKRPADIIHIGYIGRLSPEKGFDLVLKSFEEICHLENFVLDIYSSGSIPRFRDAVNLLEKKFPNKIQLHGKYENADFQQIAESIDFALVPSRFDTFNRVVRELIYFGVPVIATDFFGASIIENDRNGIKIPVEDYKSLTRSITYLLQNPSQIEKLSNGALNTPIASLENEIDGIYTFYTKIMSGSKKLKTEYVPNLDKYNFDINLIEKLFSQREYIQSYVLLNELIEKYTEVEKSNRYLTELKEIFNNSSYNQEIVFGNLESPAANFEFTDSFTAHGWVISPVTENIEILILINEQPFLPNRAYREDVVDVYKQFVELNTRPGFVFNVNKEYLIEGTNSFVCYAMYNGNVIKVLERSFLFKPERIMDNVQLSRLNEHELILLAEEKIQEEKFDEAQILLNLILTEVNPKSIDALNNIATVYIMEKNYQQALDRLVHILKIEPENKTALDNLTYLQTKVDELMQTKGLSTLTIPDKTINEKELLLEAEELIELKEYNKATAKLNLILQKNRNNVDALNDLAVIAILENNIEKALLTIKDVLKIEPANEIALDNLEYLKKKPDVLTKTKENNGDDTELPIESIISWNVGRGIAVINSIEHKLRINCPECSNEFNFLSVQKFKKEPGELTVCCPKCKQTYAFSEEYFYDYLKSKYDRLNHVHVDSKNEKPRIAYFVKDAHVISGGAKVVFQHINWLMKLGVDVIVYSFEPEPKWIDFKINFRQIKSINELNDKEFDQIIVFSIFEIPAVIKRVHPSRVFLFCQGFEGYHYGKDYEDIRADKYFLEEMHRLPFGSIVISKHLVDLFKEKFGKESYYIPNGIDHNVFKPLLPLSSREKSIVFIGNPFHPLKGFLFLLKTLKAIQNSNYKIEGLKLRIAMGSKMKDKYVSKLEKNLEKETGLTVEISTQLAPVQIATILQESSLVICSSIYEGFSLPLVEAMACGTPIITTRNMGAESFCIDRKNSLIVNYGDFETLSERIIKIMVNTASCYPLVNEGIKTASEFNERRTFNELVKVFEEIMGTKFEKSIVEKLLNEASAPQKLSDKELKAMLASSEVVRESEVKDLVSIIIPTYNKSKYVVDAIKSIEASIKSDYEIIIIDDCSTEDFFEPFKNNDKVTVYRNDENLGFPKSVNRGIKASSGKYLLLVNNDTICTEGSIDRMIEIAESDQKIGLVGVISNNASGPQMDRNTSYNTLQQMHSYAKKLKLLNKEKQLVFPRVAFLFTLIKREVVDKIGGLDERFSPGYFEDDDYCLRAQLAGFKGIIAYDVFIHHFGSVSFGEIGEENRVNLSDRSKGKFIDKWGADPEEIWLRGKTFRKRNPSIPIDVNPFVESMKRAMIYLNDKDYEQALIYLNEAIDNFDKYSRIGFEQLALIDILNLAGNTALMNGDLEQAQQYFEKELQQNPNSSRACAGLGEVFFAAEMFEESKTMFEWSLKYEPSNNNALNGLKKVNGVLQLEEGHNTLES